MTNALLGIDTTITVLAAGLIFFLALCLGVWKYRQMAMSETHSRRCWSRCSSN
jgi:hypothetical protein